MSGKILVNGKVVKIDPNKPIGSGGEGDVWDIGNGVALKIFKGPDHPDYAGTDPQCERDREGAALRLKLIQEKLIQFPKMPAQVIAPQDLARDQKGTIVGYTMPFVTGAEVLRTFTKMGYRNTIGIDNNGMQRILLDLMGVVSAVHRTGTQIGDFNYLGVLVQNGRSLLIDADSFQFGKFKCRSFTTRFVDPTLCKKDQLLLAADPSELSDWYAFALMVFECLTFTSPYGGVVKAGQYQKLPASDRPLRRVSVLSKDVQYPVKGVPLDRLPDEFLEYYHQLLEKDVRGVFPQKILEQMRWTRCPNCDWEFAKRSCPMCAVKAPSAYFVEDRRGKLLLRPIFRSNGRILAATLEGKMLRYLYHENGAFYREGSGKVIEGALGGKLKVRLLGSATYFSEGDTLAKVDPPHPIQVTPVDSYRGAYAAFDSNGDGMFHVSGGRLVRTGELGERFLARVLANQTLFWVGPKFGLATYRAGNIRSTIVFDAENGAVNEVALPRLSGDPLDAACYFTSNACWYFVATQERSETIHHCFLISKTGEVLASRSEKEGSDSWLDSFTGKVAMTMSKPGGKAVPSLLSIGEHGLLRIELDDESSLVETTRWTDARGVLRPTDKLLLGADGLFVIRPNEIINVKVS